MRSVTSLGGVSSLVFHNLTDNAFRRGRGNSDLASLAGSVASSPAALKDVPKHRRQLVDKPLSKYFGGAPTAADITKLKRAETTAKQDKAEEEAAVIRQHITAMSCASQLNFPEMCDIAIEELAVMVEVLVTPGSEEHPKGLCHDAGLPKRNFAELALRYGIEFLPPKSKNFDFVAFLKHGELLNGGKGQDIDYTCPVLCCKQFDDGDRHSGIAAQAFREVLCLYVIKPMLAKDMVEAKPSLVMFLVHLVKYLDGVAEKDQKFGPSSPCLSEFRLQLSGLLFLLADIPFVQGANIAGVDAIDKGSDKFCLAIKDKNSILGNGVMNRAWMWSMGESKHWPDIQDTVVKLESQQESVVSEGVEESLEKYMHWKTQVRPTALKNTLDVALVNAFSKKIKAQELDNGSLDDSPENDNLRLILGQVQACNSLFSDIRLHHMFQRMRTFSGNVNAMSKLVNFVETMEGFGKFNVFECNEADLESELTKVKAAIPNAPSCIAIKDDERQRIVLNTMDQLMKYALPIWISAHEIIVAIATSFKSQVEFTEIDTKDASIQELFSSVNHQTRLFLSVRSLQSAEATYMSLGADQQGRFAATGSLEAIKEVAISLKHVREQMVECGQFATLVEGEQYTALTRASEASIQHCKTSYTNVALELLSKELKDLNDLAGGCKGGKNWKDALSKPKSGKGCLITWAQLRDGSVETLQKLDNHKLAQHVKSTCQVPPLESRV